MKRVAVIGSGVAGLSSAAILASRGLDVHVFEKNETIGGRARVLNEHGFTFDMGPSWYWMPEVYENFYKLFNHTSSDFYDLKRLSPSYKIILKDSESVTIPDRFSELCELFETYEKGAANKLIQFIQDAKNKYDLAMSGLINKPGDSVFEFLDIHTLSSAIGLKLFSSFSSHLNKYFKNPVLISILQFPVLFLGATPAKIPALYSLMNYAAAELGTWYPVGGFGKVIEAFKFIAEEEGVKFHTSETVEKLSLNALSIHEISTKKGKWKVDAVIGAADYNHIEQNLIDSDSRMYSKKYWENRVMAPSCLIFYLGVNKKIGKLDHHNLFFDADYDAHAREIYYTDSWPNDPLFYVCCPSKTDSTVAPENMENLFVLMPLSTGVTDSDEIRESYFQILISRIENYTGEDIKSSIIFKKSYCMNDFVKDYNAYKGNAYGLANTLKQTAIFKPKMRSKKIKNLFYTGQLTVPGPGVPPAIISGQIASKMLLNQLGV